MHYYQVSLQYDGSDYAGFQWQKNLPTIQAEINQAFAKILKGKFSTTGASRTDSGVHALHQVVKLTCEEAYQERVLLKALRENLPSQIRVLSIEQCAPLFHPTAMATCKEYRYLFTNLKGGPLASQKYLANIANPLDVEVMQQVTMLLVGRHDFKNFYSTGSNVKSTVRVIERAELSRINPHALLNSAGLFAVKAELTECFEFKIAANGFLKQMIRHLVSALWMVGSEKLSREDFIKLLQGPQITQKPWRIAAARGLFLTKVTY